MRRREIVQRMTDLLEERKAELNEGRIMSDAEIKDYISPGGEKRRFESEKKRYTRKLASNGDYELVGTGDGVVALTKNGKFIAGGDFDRGADSFFVDPPGTKQKAWREAQDIVDYAASARLRPE